MNSYNPQLQFPPGRDLAKVRVEVQLSDPIMATRVGSVVMRSTTTEIHIPSSQLYI